MEHEKDRSSPQEKGRKTEPEGDKQGRVGKITQKKLFNPSLSSIVKEQNKQIS
jgi:hypothetical protein